MNEDLDNPVSPEIRARFRAYKQQAEILSETSLPAATV
jgi:hypothetical protein